MVSPRKVSNQVFKRKTPEPPCERHCELVPQIEAIDVRVTNLEMIVHSKLSELTTHINRLADRLDRSAM